MSQDALLLQSLLNIIIDCLNLSLTIPAAHHEITGKVADLPDIQQHNIRSLLVTGYLYHLPGDVYPFQQLTSIRKAYPLIL